MAASSSDESCSAPTDFDISSSIEDSNGKYYFTCERCPLCLTAKRVYYCKDCIMNGDFVHSPYMKHKESFYEKKSMQLHLKRDRLLILSKVSTEYENRTKTANIKIGMVESKEKIRLLKLAIADKKKEVEQIKNNVAEMRKDVASLQSVLPEKFKRVHRIQNSLDKCLRVTNQLKSELHALKSVYKEDIRLRVSELVELIFPVSRVCLDEPRQDDSLNQATISALAEATQTAFVSGRWVYTENSGNVFYRIVKPLIPANGDYSAYSEWVASNRDSVPSTEISQEQQARAISAALTYLSQLVTVLSFYLDIWLPHRMCYSDFGIHELNPQEFEGTVAKLNANILHLCLLQNVNPEFLNTRRSAYNLTLLLDPSSSDLGRFGPMTWNIDPLIEDLNIEINYNLDSEEESECLGDWEKIDDVHGMPPRFSYNTKPTKHQHQILSGEATTSTAGGLMQSAAATLVSFWRAAAWQK